MNKKKIYILLTTATIFIIHIILQFILPFFALGYTLQVFDNPDTSDIYLRTKDNILFILYTIISFPILFIMNQIEFIPKTVFGDIIWLIGFLLNSLLWTFSFYFLISYFSKK